MATVSAEDFRKGLKVLVDGNPCLMVECQFVKPGKGQAIYRTRMRNLLRGTMVDKTYRSGESLEIADIHDTEMQYLYKSGDKWVFMDPETFEQPELDEAQVGESAKWLKDGLMCRITFWNEKPIAMEPPNHLVLEVVYTEPGFKGNTATNITKPAKVETGAEVGVPPFIEVGNLIKVDTRTGEYLERVREK
jgi:elongation factor P